MAQIRLKLTALLLSSIFLFSFNSSKQSEISQGDDDYPKYENGYVTSEKMLMGWCTVDNKRIGDYSLIDLTMKLQEKKIYLIAQPENDIPLSSISSNNLNNGKTHDIKGLKLLLVNLTDDTLRQTLQDGSLRVIQEAKDENGNWNPIEYWVNSWCGNSYFGSLTLPPNSYIELGVYRYSGNFNTVIRTRLSLNRLPGKDIIVSNEYEGSINTGQFINEQETSPWFEYF